MLAGNSAIPGIVDGKIQIGVIGYADINNRRRSLQTRSDALRPGAIVSSSLCRSVSFGAPAAHSAITTIGGTGSFVNKTTIHICAIGAVMVLLKAQRADEMLFEVGGRWIKASQPFAWSEALVRSSLHRA